MPVTLLDLIVVGVMLVSALLAMVRGFTREVLSIAAWVVAAAAALLLHQHVIPFVSPYISNAMAAQFAAGGIVFIVTLIIVSFITIRISDIILDSRIGAVDRALGFVFGAARGALLAVVAFLFFAWMVPEKGQPTWVLESRAKPMLLSGGAWLMRMLPDDPESAIIKRLRNPDFLPSDTTGGEEEAAPAGDGTAPAEGTPAPAPAQPSSN